MLAAHGGIMGMAGDMWVMMYVLLWPPLLLRCPYLRGPAPINTLCNSVGKHDLFLFLAAGSEEL